MNIAKNVAKLFAYPEGPAVLSHLKHMTQERVLPPDSGDNELWFLEGQRALVALIIGLIHQGQQKGENNI